MYKIAFLFRILLIFLYAPFTMLVAQEIWEPILFESFDDSTADDWNLENGWLIIKDHDNFVMKGENHTWCNYDKGYLWSDYQFTFKVKLKGSDGLHINFRKGDEGRYFIGFDNNGVYLNKESPWGSFYDLESDLAYHANDIWYMLNIRVSSGNIVINVNEQTRINYFDESYIHQGTIAFESLDNSIVYIDDILVEGKPLPKIVSEYKWRKTGGPIGGLGYDIRIDPEDNNIMYVTDNPSGVNKSIDRGSSWYQSNFGIVESADEMVPIFSLSIDPNNSDIIWCGTQNKRGIYKSTDAGDNWYKMDNGIIEDDAISFRGFAICPGNSKIVLAAAEIATEEQGIEFNKTKGKIYKTTDGGLNWYSTWEGDNLARVLVFDPNESNTIYCSTGIFDREAFSSNEQLGLPGGEGILKSRDQGENWFNINNGIDNLYTGFLEMHPYNPNILFAASGNNAWEYPPNNLYGGIYKTNDAGQTWVKVLGEDNFTVVTLSKFNPEIVYAGSASGLYRSNDQGASWTKLQKEGQTHYGPPGVRAGVPISAVVDPLNSDILFVNNYGGGNFKSIDGAKTWSISSKGYSGADLRDVVVLPHNRATIYTIGRIGPFISRNGGVDWEGLSYGDADFAEWYDIEVNPINTNEILISDEHSIAIIKSIDGGYNWREVFRHPNSNAGNPNERYGFKKIAYAPSNPNIVYAGISTAGNTSGSAPYKPGLGMYKSYDRGETWEAINYGLVDYNKNINDILVHPQNSNIAYVATLFDGILKTEDGGSTWQILSNGLVSANVRSLALHHANPNVIIAGLGDGAGIMKLDLNNTNWVSKNMGIKIECPSYLSNIGQVLNKFSLVKIPRFVNKDYYQIPWTSVEDVVFDPNDPIKVYAADINSGVYFSPNQGENWYPINENLNTKSVTSLSISSDSKIIYASTAGGGVYRLTFGENFKPDILSTIPSNDDTTHIIHSDSLEFIVFAYDLNDDLLSYNWYIDNEFRGSNSNGSSYFLHASSLTKGPHLLSVIVSDSDTSSTVNWNISIYSEQTYTYELTSNLPIKYALEQNYPNPYNNKTIIKYTLPAQSHVDLKIYDILGRETKTLVNNMQEPGYYVTHWDGKNNDQRNVASGIYICKIYVTSNSDVFTTHRKISLLR
jgi:photosystem II stability/assembly factor-like uncharacterized protein